MKKNSFLKTDSKKIAPLLLILFCCVFTTFAQKDSTGKNHYYLWANLGVNAGLSTNSTFLSGPQLGLNFSINQNHNLKINLYSCGTIEFFRTPPNKLRYIRNISFQYGFMHYYSKSTAIILSAGISYGEALYRGNFLYYDQSQSTGILSSTGNIYEMDNYNYWGIPIDFTILWTAPRNGFSIDVFANFHKHSDYGLRLNYNVGKIRNRPTKNM